MCSFAATLSHRPNFSCLLWGSSRRVGQIDDTHPKKSIERYTSQWWNCETSNRNLRFLEAGGGGRGRDASIVTGRLRRNWLLWLNHPFSTQWGEFNCSRQWCLLHSFIQSSETYGLHQTAWRPAILSPFFYRPTTSYSLLVGRKLSSQRTRLLVPVFR